MLLCWYSPMKEPVLQIRLKKQLSGGRVPHLLQRKHRGEERKGSLVSAGLQAQWAKVQVQSGSGHICDLRRGSRNGSAALHVFLLCGIKSTATFFPWKAEKQASINGQSRWESEDRLTARRFSVSQKSHERFKLETGNEVASTAT